MDDIEETVRRCLERIEELEQRVTDLEAINEAAQAPSLDSSPEKKP